MGGHVRFRYGYSEATTLSDLAAPMVRDGPINGNRLTTNVAQVLVPELRPGIPFLLPSWDHRAIPKRYLQIRQIAA